MNIFTFPVVHKKVTILISVAEPSGALYFKPDPLKEPAPNPASFFV